MEKSRREIRGKAVGVGSVTVKNGTETEKRDSKGRFTKGNPGGPGRPTLENSLTSVLRENVDAQEVARVLVDLAVKDRYFPALKYIYDRIDGNTLQKITMENSKDAEWLELAQSFFAKARAGEYADWADPESEIPADRPEPVSCVRPVLAPAEQRYDEDGLDDRDY